MPDGRLIFNVVMLAADTENYPCPHPFLLKVLSLDYGVKSTNYCLFNVITTCL